MLKLGTKVDDMLKAWTKADDAARIEGTKRLGLPDNNTAADRAKAMGFGDETYYHGTSEDFNEFNDVTTYVSTSPDIATDFAFMDNGGGYALDGAELTEDMLYRGHGGQYAQPSIMPLKVRANDTFDYANPNHIDEISPRVGDASIERIEGGNYEDIEDAIPEIARKDFDSIRVNESQKAGFDSTIDNLGLFNPNGNIRSPLAHFNPKYAGIGGAGSVLSADPGLTSLTLVTTCLAAAAGGVFAALVSAIRYKNLDLTMFLNGILGGLVGITAGADQMSPTDAIIIGAIAKYNWQTIRFMPSTHQMI